jgi:hypothetical protein
VFLVFWFELDLATESVSKTGLHVVRFAFEILFVSGRPFTPSFGILF